MATLLMIVLCHWVVSVYLLDLTKFWVCGSPGFSLFGGSQLVLGLWVPRVLSLWGELTSFGFAGPQGSLSLGGAN